ncbi:unnamed protein product [Oreochromis niloticus]|nr:unnamed protein product [Mustela putorius furo]
MWPSSDLTARPCLASAASERHFSPGSPEETPLHKMLFLPAAALCCLCSALVTMAAEQLIQEDLTLTRRVGESVSFSCGGTDQCDGSRQVLWFQKKETFTLILIINKDTSEVQSVSNDFSAKNTVSGCELKIVKVKLDHSATYYCSCYKSAPHTGPRVHVEGNSSVLCVPPAMFPHLVQLSCKRQKKYNQLEELPPADQEQLELRKSGRSASVLLIHQNSTYKCNCSMKHEGGTVEAQTQQEVPAPAASCPPEREPADLPALQPADLSFQSQCRVKLLCLLYTVLIVKSLVYCCGLSLLMILTNKGPSTNCTHAD